MNDSAPLKSLSCLYMNARSLKAITPTSNKLVELQNLVASHDVRFISITETWLNSSVLDGEILPQGFTIHRKDREETAPDQRGGGVMLAFHTSLHSRRRKDLEATGCEILVCEVSCASRSLGVILCYRPPSADKRAFNRSLEITLLNVAKEYPIFCVLGDFNLPAIRWCAADDVCNNADSDFVRLMNSFFLTQLNVTPSNVHNHIIDLIFTNTLDLIENVCDLHADYPTDHTVLHFDLLLHANDYHNVERVVFNFKHVDFDVLSHAFISSSLYDIIQTAPQVDTLWLNWSRAVLDVTDLHVPKFKVKRKQDPPWFDREVRHSIKCKNTAWRRAKRINNEAEWANFRRTRNQTKSLLRTKYDSYIEALAETCKTNAKRFWSFFRLKTKSRIIPKELTGGGTNCIEPKAKADLFNTYFCSVFNNGPAVHGLQPPQDRPTTISVPSFTTEEVLEVLKKLDTNSASPPGDIPLVILRHCAPSLAPSLTAIFNICMSAASVPNEWKKANIVPVHKKGEKHIVSNYRPISVLCGVSKVMERCVFNYLFSHIGHLIHPLQHGFIKGRSCCTQLLKVYHEIGSILDNGGQIDLIFLDFSKAFDCISHDLLLFKLKHFYGLDEMFLAWASSYLHNRSQRVLVEGVASGWSPVTSGVPQGSILGPLFFLLFINDMPPVASSSQTALFADDSKCFKSISSLSDCIQLQNDLHSLFNWSQSWQMKFNPTKCKVMSFTRSRNPIRYDYSIDGVTLEYVDCFTDLGVIVDCNLNFHSHIDSIVNKSSRVSGMIKRSVGFNAPQSVKLNLYKSLCRSILESASQVWSPHNKEKIRQIEAVQRQMSKFILNDFTTCYTDRCKSLELLPLSYRREIADLIFAYKVLNDLINVDFTNELHAVTQSSHSLRSNNGLFLNSYRYGLQCIIRIYGRYLI